MVQNLSLSLSGDPLRRTSWSSVLSDRVRNIAVHTVILGLNGRAGEEKLRLADLFNSHSRIRRINDAAELGHFPDGKIAIRCDVLPQIRSGPFAFNDEGLDL